MHDYYYLHLICLKHILREAAKMNDYSRSASSTWLEQLETEATTWVTVLVREEVARTLQRSDLDKLLELIEILPSNIVASQQIGLGQDKVGSVLRAFYASLFSTVAPHFDRLQDPEFREITRKKTAESVAEAHDKVNYTIKINLPILIKMIDLFVLDLQFGDK